MESGNFFNYALPYIVGFIFLALTEREWIKEELTIPVDGHEVAKVIMVLFVTYMHAFISLSLEMVTLTRLFISPKLSIRSLKKISYLKKIVRFVMKHSAQFNLGVTVIWSTMISKLSIVLWKYVLLWHVCSSHSTRCQNFHVGRFARSLKVMICGEPHLRKSVMCQITMDHAPLIWFGLVVILTGHIFLPYLNVYARKLTWNSIKRQKNSNSAKIKG